MHFVFWKTRGTAIKLVLWVSSLPPSHPSSPVPHPAVHGRGHGIFLGMSQMCKLLTSSSDNIPISYVQLLAKTVWLEMEVFFFFRIIAPEMHKQARSGWQLGRMGGGGEGAGGALSSCSIWRVIHCSNTQASLSLVLSLFLSESRDLPDWLIRRRI